jgi:hypothetical protein
MITFLLYNQANIYQITFETILTKMLEDLNKIHNVDDSGLYIDIDSEAINFEQTEPETESLPKNIIQKNSLIADTDTIEIVTNGDTISEKFNLANTSQDLFLEQDIQKGNSNSNPAQKQTNNFDLNNNFGWLGNASTDLANQTHLLVCNCYACHSNSLIEEATSIGTPTIAAAEGATYKLDDIPVLRSNPNATAKIYLDFNGHTTTGTYWNSWIAPGKNIVTPAYSLDADTATFNDAELTAIEQIWQRVAEDYAPFNVDVTTVAPANYNAKTAIRVAIGGSASDWYGSGAGGVAFVGSWSWSGDIPAFVFENNLGGNIKNVAEAISHEVGHTLNLKHQSTYDSTGKRTQEYNSGSGNGETSWAPVMGVGYNKSLTTWHNGTNSNSSTSYQDDMSVIASSGNGFGYRQDDWGNTIATAGVLTGSTQLSASGVISTMADVDVFRFTTGAGTVIFDIKGASLGQNLDVLAKLLDDKGNELVVSNPGDKINASISTALNAGTYYLQVGSNGQYGRVGQYTVAGNVAQGTVVTPPEASINNVSVTEGQEGNTATFTVNLSQAATGAVSVDFATANGTASSGTDYTAKTGTINFAAGETSKTITVAITDDSLVEVNETFNVNLSNAKGVTIKDANGIGTIVSDDITALPEISINNVSVTEGQAGNTATFTVNLSQAATGAVSVDFATANGTASSGADYTAKTGTINFAAGETSKTINVAINDDSLVEVNETFNINLSNAKGVTIKDANGIGTIVSDDIATPPVSGTMGEIGRVTNASSTVKTFTFQNTYQNPVVFAQPLSRNGGDSAVVRITDIASNGFSFFVDEPNSSDDIHAEEAFSFMVLEAGTWKLDNGATVRVGTINTDANVNNNWQNVDLGSDFTATPVVLTQVQSDNGADFVRTRQQNTSASSFSVAMEKEEEFVNSTYTQEKIGWFAITGGTGDWNGFTYQADYTGDHVTNRFSTLSFEPDFKTSPQILGNVASYNDPDPVGLRYRRLSDVKVDIMLDEDQGLDDERTHGTENVSFLAIEGTGTLTGTRDSGIANGLAEGSTFSLDSNLFILGNELGSFYSYRGDTDYASIGNFQVDRGDTIQLYGSASDYHTVGSEDGLSASTSIYDAKDDLIAIVKGVSSLDLDSSTFSFI